MSETVDPPVVLRPPMLSNILAHSASGPSLSSLSSSHERPFTISSAYDRSLSRPPVTARTFEPLYASMKVQACSSLYATPTNIRRQTADIYSRPTVTGRRFSQGVVPVAPPVVPCQYATCQKAVTDTGARTNHRPSATDRKDEMMQAYMHRSSSLPSPVYSNVCDFSALM